MSDRQADFREAYQALLDRMPDPPPFDRIMIRSLEPIPPYRRPWATALIAAVAVLVVIGGVTLLARDGVAPEPDEGIPVATTVGEDEELMKGPPPGQGVFSEPTGMVLVFDDGHGGVFAVDLDSGVSGHRVLEGQRPGDPDYRLERVDDHLVVGWGTIFALPLDTLEGRELGQATVFIPAVEPGMVWMIDYPGGEGTPVYRQVTLDGIEIVSAPGLPVGMGTAAHGIPGGIVHEVFDSGIALWYPDSDLVRIPGSRTGFVSDVSTVSIVWCEGTCVESLRLTDVDGEDRVVFPPNGGQFFQAPARFSPDLVWIEGNQPLARLADGRDHGTPRKTVQGAFVDRLAPFALIEVRAGLRSRLRRESGKGKEQQDC